jgi:mono/diheme cytochrome c family protein
MTRAGLLGSLLALSASASIAAVPPNSEAFEMHVRPVLVKACYGCHAEGAMGGLQLDSREHLLKGGKSGPGIVPGDPDASKLIQAIRYTGERKMPPTRKLKDEEIASLEAWVKAGAIWPEGSKSPTAASPKYVITPEQRNFWAFRPIANPLAPMVRDKKWAKSELDLFILSKLEEKGLKPVAAADRRTLIRRASLDLTGLPPTPEEVAAFEQDKSQDAFAKVVDRLLASSHYGERWGRYWLDVARYSDGKLNSEFEEPYPNAFRYRDWVVEAVNQDMPYDKFVKAQIAGDLMPEPERYQAGLGFYSLSPEFVDDRVDATTRGFMALTVACAQCHDHKFDPIPTRDYYSLLGVFNNTELHQTPLVSKDEVEQWQAKKKNFDGREKEFNDFISSQGQQLAEILASQASRYMMAAADAGPKDGLDEETLTKWTGYLKRERREHGFLKAWLQARDQHGDVQKASDDFQVLLLKVNAEKKEIDDKNHITLGANPNRNDLSSANLVSLERDRFVLWEEFFSGRGMLRYGNGKIDRFLSGQWKTYLETLKASMEAAKKDLPPQYPFLQTISDLPKWKDQHVWLRGSKDNPGDLTPPHFLQILSKGDPETFQGKTRLELAERVASTDNPLTARVMVNRVWQHHFGQGLVRTPSNFGLQGDRPSHPELLDYLASRFMKEGWSLKKLHREMMLSATYQMSAANAAANFEQDPDNRLLWRFNRHRLDVEGLRDSLLYVSGNFDPKAGGPPEKSSAESHRRTMYGYVSRYKLESVLGLFDFPNPVGTSEQRMETNVPLQRLYFMNSEFLMKQSTAFAGRLGEGDDAAKIVKAYAILFQRAPTAEEKQLGLTFLQETHEGWPQYAQVLLSSNEFSFLN